MYGELIMAIINQLSNTASVLFNGNPVNSNNVSTNLLLAPTLLKAVDKLTANIGDVLTYTVTITNLSLTEMTSVPFTDILPAGCSYVTDSFELNGKVAVPTVVDNTLTYIIATIAPLGIATIQFQSTVVGGRV